MTRHWFASGLVLGTLLASTTFAQVSTDPAAKHDRVSQLRPGWSRDEIDPAIARAQYIVAPAPTQLAQATESRSRSFLPNWFGRRYDKPEEQSNSKSDQNYSGRTGSTNSNTNSRRQSTGKTAEADSMPPDPAMMPDDPLPGLGGSPLPRAGGQPPHAGSTSKSDGSTLPGMQPRAVQKKPPSSTASVPNWEGLRNASREPLRLPSATSTTKNSTSTTRNSPGRRTAPHITPEELRRELSGTFPVPSTSSESTPHAAQADERAESPSETAKPLDAADMPADEGDEAVISDAPLTLPTTPPAQEDVAAPDVKPILAEPQRIDSPSNGVSSRNAADAFGDTQHSRSAYGTGNSVHMPFTSVIAPPASRGKEAFGDALQAAGGGDPKVLVSSQTPVLTVDIRGPKQILVGREALYRVRLQNQSDVAAEGIVATVSIPAGAEVINSAATQGSVQPSRNAQSAGQLQWQIARLENRAGETLEIRLVPRESRPLELGVSWTLAPVGSRAVVEVQEAKLSLEIAGPSEVLFDKPQVFKLTLTNPGTGAAENVKIDLMPPSGGQDAVSSHPLGDLAAGASQTVEVELTARDAGKMFVKAVASADGDLTCDASKEIFCRKPELEVDWRGPATKYAGTMATYFIRVRNPGTAPAEDVTVRATLPEGAEFTSASEGQSYDAGRRELAWHVGKVGPGDDNYMEFKCVLKTPGKNFVKMSAASAAGDLTDNKSAETNVVAIADLKLEVTDPSGPVAVGAQTMYEIHIRNRGASAAKDVNVVALFSDGIEPEQAEGAMYSVSDGRVSFRTIDELPAGREIVLRIRAHAVQPGTHVFRAEVLCRDLEIKLAAEETTRFYADDVTPAGDQPQNEAASRSSAFEAKVK